MPVSVLLSGWDSAIVFVASDSPLLWVRREQETFERRCFPLHRIHTADDVSDIVDGVCRLKRPRAVGCDFSIQIKHREILPEKCMLLVVAGIRPAHDLAPVVDTQRLAVNTSK